MEVLAERWYGEAGLWPVIAVANHIADADPQPGHVLIRPRLNRRHTVVAGDTLWDLANYNYGDGGADRTLTLVKMVAAANLIADRGGPDRIPFPMNWPNCPRRSPGAGSGGGGVSVICHG